MNEAARIRHAAGERRRRRRLAGKTPADAPPWHDVTRRHAIIVAMAERFPGAGHAALARHCGCSRALIYKVLDGKGRVSP